MTLSKASMEVTTESYRELWARVGREDQATTLELQREEPHDLPRQGEESQVLRRLDKILLCK